MSIFNWFTRTASAKKSAASESSSLGHVQATIPLMPPDRLQVKPGSLPATRVANAKTERLERRELLYSVVRDSMIRAGVLVASYKFKVLSLDVHGMQYLIMMELANRSVGDSDRLAEIEAMMALAAKMRHGILVTAVYWRVNEHVTAGLSPSHASHAPQTAAKAPEIQAARLPTLPVARHLPKYEPPQPNEVTAFKRALAGAMPATSLSASGQIVTSGRRNPAPSVAFEDTQMFDHDLRASPLSTTQYGDLN